MPAIAGNALDATSRERFLNATVPATAGNGSRKAHTILGSLLGPILELSNPKKALEKGGRILELFEREKPSLRVETH